MRKLLIFSMACVIGNFLRAQDVSKKLDSFYAALGSNGQLNGNVLVAADGRIIYQKSFGYADMEHKIANTLTTGFQLASLSKVFTAVATLQLAEKKRLKPDDPVSKYFPAFPYKGITIRQLLSHTSGLSDQALAGTIDSFERKNGRVHDNNDIVPLLAAARVKLKLSPGEKWWYCNLGYELLATLVEQISGERFEQYLSKHIFGPAHMAHSFLSTGAHPQRLSNVANNYDYRYRFSPARVLLDTSYADYREAAFGHSNIVSTTVDLLRFDSALQNGLLLSAHTMEEASRPALLVNGKPNSVWLNIGGMGEAFDGLGWFIFQDTSAGKTVWHAGGMHGCATILLRNLSRHQTVILLDNTGSEGLYKSALSGLRILNNGPVLFPKRSLAKLYGKALVEKGIDYGFSRLMQLQADTVHYSLTENDMNNLGYEFLEHGYDSMAVETFKTNVSLYPRSDNVFNSYAEALLKIGKKEEAILMYKKSLELNASNEDSRKSLEALVGSKR